MEPKSPYKLPPGWRVISAPEGWQLDPNMQDTLMRLLEAAILSAQHEEMTEGSDILDDENAEEYPEALEMIMSAWRKGEAEKGNKL